MKTLFAKERSLTFKNLLIQEKSLLSQKKKTIISKKTNDRSIDRSLKTLFAKERSFRLAQKFVNSRRIFPSKENNLVSRKIVKSEKCKLISLLRKGGFGSRSWRRGMAGGDERNSGRGQWRDDSGTRGWIGERDSGRRWPRERGREGEEGAIVGICMNRSRLFGREMSGANHHREIIRNPCTGRPWNRVTVCHFDSARSNGRQCPNTTTMSKSESSLWSWREPPPPFPILSFVLFSPLSLPLPSY